MPPKSTRSGEYIETDNGNKISRRAQLHATQHIILAGKSVIQHDVIIRGDLVRQQAPAQAPPPKPTADASSKQPTPAPQAQTVSVHLGRYVFISPGCTLHPPSRLSTTTTTAQPQTQNQALTSTSTTLATRRASAQATPLSPLSTAPSQPLTYTNPSLPKPSSQTHTQNLTYYPLRILSHVYLGPGTYCSAAQIGSHVYIGARCTVGNMVIIKDCVRVEDDTVLPAGTVWRSGVVVKGRPGRVVGEVGEGWVNGAMGEGGGGGSGGGGGFEGWGRELWASVGNHVRKERPS